MRSTEDRAIDAEREIGRINAFFPLMQQLGNRWAASRPFEGQTIALNLHLTSLTGALVRELALGGGKFVVSAANRATTDAGVVEVLRNAGVDVYTGGEDEDLREQVLAHKPTLLVDVGFDLIAFLIEHRPESAAKLRGAVEITRSGITKMRERKSLPFPVVNINDGRLKDAIENRHGVGEAIWQAVARLTGMHLSGRRVAVVGYGAVGRGLAAYARAAGMNVEVVEVDPVRRLAAHYDGYPTPQLAQAIARVGTLVTATGHAKVVPVDLIQKARDGIVLVNAGHGGDEIDVTAAARAASRVDHISDEVVRYRFEGGPRVTVLGGGHPLNIVLNSGSPEPVLLHFAVIGLVLEKLVSTKYPPGEITVPAEIESTAAAMALDALGLAGG